MLAVVAFIIFTFSKNKTTSTSGDFQTKSSFSFANLLLRKKAGPTGSQIDTGSQGTDLGGQTGTDASGDTTLPGSNTDTNTDFTTEYLTSLPDPSIFTSGTGTNINPGGTGTTGGGGVVLPGGGGGGGGTNKNDPCVGTILSQKVRIQLCGAGPNPNVNLGISAIPFTLNDEEQAELDRLSRAFARLAPYLKTDGDVSAEQANNEAYNDFVTEANGLVKKTDEEMLSSTYKGPKVATRHRPFIEGSMFKPGTMLSQEVFGIQRSVKVSLFKLIFPNGIQILGQDVGGGDGENFAKDAVSSGLAGVIGPLVEDKLNDILVSFVASSRGQKLDKCNNLDRCDYNIFEEVLNIE